MENKISEIVVICLFSVAMAMEVVMAAMEVVMERVAMEVVMVDMEKVAMEVVMVVMEVDMERAAMEVVMVDTEVDMEKAATEEVDMVEDMVITKFDHKYFYFLIKQIVNGTNQLNGLLLIVHRQDNFKMYLKMDVNTFQKYLDTYTDNYELSENGF